MTAKFRSYTRIIFFIWGGFVWKTFYRPEL